MFLGKVPGDPGKIIHQGDGILEYIVVNALQGIAIPSIGIEQKGVVYIAIAKGLSRDNTALQPEA